MLNTIHQFRDRIEQLRLFFSDAESINAFADWSSQGNKDDSEAIGVHSRPIQLQSSKINRRVQTYVSGIISLYSLFEQYVEDILIAYLEELNSIIDDFNSMPKKIKENHTNLSAQLLLNRNLDKYRDECDENDIIQRMQSSSSTNSFRINALAYIDHKSNFRIETLNQFFEPIGVSGISARIKNTPTFKKHCSEKYPGDSIHGLPDAHIFADLDDLAWRRNIVAHRWPDDTLSIQMMLDRTEFICIMGECIYEALHQCILSHRAEHQYTALPTPLKVYDSQIVCFHLQSGRFQEDMQILARRPDGIYIEGRITRIEVNNIQQMEITTPPAIDAAFAINFRIKHNYKFFVINQ